MSHSLREWLAFLEGKGKLKRVRKEVDPVFEIAALGKQADGICSLLFERVKGYAVPVVTGLAGDRELFAAAMSVPVEGMLEKLAAAVENPVPCRLVSPDGAPVKECIIRENIDLLKMLPIPTHHAGDAGPYITAAILIARDPDSGVRNVSIHRLQVTGPDRLGILILPRHLWHFFGKAERAGRPLEIALAIGVHPAVLLASQATTRLGVDELEIASALLPQPLELVKCETVDVEVPAGAEIVIEGKILPGVREVEGPFGEYPRYYGPAAPRPVVEVTAVTHRRQPVYHTIIPASREHLLLGGIAREAVLLQTVRQAVPTVKNVHLTPGGSCRYHAVISIEKKHEGEAKNAIFAAFTSSSEVKHVVVVDHEINIFDPEEVEWAVATRCQAGRDVFIVKDAMGNRLDPSSRDGVSDKMGIDATIPLNLPGERFERISIPGLDKIKLADYLE
ncbi:3-polyprenyl-4-hydroxybenzoate decarboxylase and related decarboxylases [Pelotomaculum thermopropionicum SI]|uniref:Phenolic acid decarboxylase n=1 Tax=Pelotomaculum thermopropionicum (strain DSM 13744 / JCM 10971 / SI) TaxID=370438 RepID=A5D4Z9_PELTS|nr:3-polyprenyl-4-hydroxybenzoate decarboxylase and related decarboxylases [Pelotomaculum thermopropionicum SI]